MKPTLFILCGFPFAGKSTLCQKIVAVNPNVVHYCIDTFFDEHPELRNEEERWEYVFQYGRELTCKALKNGQHVLYDATNYLMKERGKLRRMAKNCGGDCAVIYVKIPRDIARQRLNENRKTMVRKDVEEEAWEEVTNDFEVPVEGENVIVCHWDEDKEDWIEKNFRSINQ